MKLFSKIRKNLFSIFQVVLIVLLIVLVVVFVVVMFSDCPEWIFNLLGVSGEKPKYEALKFLGIGMGGVLVALQALMSYKRAKAMEKTSEAQADAAKAQADAVSKTEEGQRQDRLKNAIEHLGNDSDSVRLGGAYELFHLAKDTKELRQTVLDILCAHIRQTTGKDEYRETHKSKPSEEVQSLLTLLFVQEYEVFEGLNVNLQGSWLNGADLKEARLAKARLTESHLQEAILDKAHLQEATLRKAHLERTNLFIAHLEEADLFMTHLEGANLTGAHLQGVNLDRAYLQGANLAMACLHGASFFMPYLQGASLRGAQLQGVDLFMTHMQGANFNEAQLQGANLSLAELQGAESVEETSPMSFEDRIKTQIEKESNLSRAIFAGGLSRDKVETLVKDLPDGKANQLREKLKPHIGKPISNQLPEDSGAITGSYTKEDAEEWIAEYEKAMSEVPEDDS